MFFLPGILRKMNELIKGDCGITNKKILAMQRMWLLLWVKQKEKLNNFCRIKCEMTHPRPIQVSDYFLHLFIPISLLSFLLEIHNFLKHFFIFRVELS